FGRQFGGAREEWQHAKTAPAGSLLDQPVTVVEQTDVTAELVDDKTTNHGGIVRIEHGLDSNHLRDDAAAIDVADQHNGNVGLARKAHIGNVGSAKVDFCGAAGALDQHEIGAILQPR